MEVATFRQIEAVLLDCSGTLINDLRLTWNIVNEIFCKFKKPRISLKKFRNQFRLPYYGIFVDYGIGEEISKRISITTYHALYAEYEHLVELFEDSKFCIDSLLKMGLKVGIVSQTPRKELDYQLKKFGLSELIPSGNTIAQGESSEEKPNAKPLLIMMERLGVEPYQTLYAGDMAEDILCARNAGVLPVAVDNPLGSYHTGTKLQQAKPEYIVQNLHALADLVFWRKLLAVI